MDVKVSGGSAAEVVLEGILPEALGQGTMAESLSVVIASDQTPVSVALPGTVEQDIADTKAAVEALEQKDFATETTLQALDAKVIKADTDNVTVVASALPTGAATEATLADVKAAVEAIELKDFATETTLQALEGKDFATETTLGLVKDAVEAIAGDTAVLAGVNYATEATLDDVKTAVETLANVNFASEATLQAIAGDLQALAAKVGPANFGVFDEDTAVDSSGSSFTAPAGAIGFVIQAPSTNSDNVRFKVGGTASSTSGFLLEPGRSETVMIGADVSYAAVSGTQELYIQWLVRT